MIVKTNFDQLYLINNTCIKVGFSNKLKQKIIYRNKNYLPTIDMPASIRNWKKYVDNLSTQTRIETLVKKNPFNNERLAFFLLGHPFKIIIDDNWKNFSYKVDISDRTIVLKTHKNYLNPADLITKFAYKYSQQILIQRAKMLLYERFEKNVNKHKIDWKIKKLNTAWGVTRGLIDSSDATICLSMYLISYDWKFIDYVICHEISHIFYKNHSREFWNFLESRFPNARSINKTLKHFTFWA